jgi:hypothetical protein
MSKVKAPVRLSARWANDFLYHLRNLLIENEVSTYLELSDLLNRQTTAVLRHPEGMEWTQFSVNTILTNIVSRNFMKESERKALFVRRNAA